MEFTSVEQRMAHGYLDTLPPFVPAADGPPEAEQRAFYDLMTALYKLTFDEPLLLVPALHPDDAYPNHLTKSAYGKPELVKSMRRFAKEMNALLENMFLLAADPGVAKPNKRQGAVLGRLGVNPAGPLPAAWGWMATRPGASPAFFSHCAFQPGYNYTGDLYARLLGNPAAFRRLEGWLLANGYRRYDGLNVTASDDPFSLTYTNPAWGQAPPRGGYEYGIKHTGIAAQYDAMRRSPAVLGLCIPGGMRRNLELFDTMDEKLQQFVAKRTKKCDACRYCVQTDKSGKRPLAAVPVLFAGETLSLCSYFPGYCYCWTALDEALVDDLIAFLAFMDANRPG